MDVSLLQVNKRQQGRFYTAGNPFLLKPFLKWIEEKHLKDKTVLEPFAGKNNLIRALREVGLGHSFKSYDIQPTDPDVEKRDTILDFPKGFDFCVTNPPWLARNSAKRRGLHFPETIHDDLYKHALDLCLQHCKYVAILIPATFLQSGILRERLDAVIFLHNQLMFTDTENPVCLALFSSLSDKKRCIKIYNDDHFVGCLDELERLLPEKGAKAKIIFNHPNGDLGFIAFDNTRSRTIRFVKGEELSEYSVGFSSRMITPIHGNFTDIEKLIDSLNADIEIFRKKTQDVFLTPFKGLRKDGQYRRRMEYGLARDFIAKHANPNTRFRI